MSDHLRIAPQELVTLKQLKQQEPAEWVEVFDTFGNSKDASKCIGHVWLAPNYFPTRGTKFYAAPLKAAPEPVAPNNDEVICPHCAHQFRAIPVNVQSLLLASGHEPPFLPISAQPPAQEAPTSQQSEKGGVDQ